MAPDLRYPIGPFSFTPPVTASQRHEAIGAISAAPGRLRAAITGLTEAQLDTPYRPGGWTVRQVVHHVPDSHLNAYLRFRLAITEDDPTIKPYEEARWAELVDARSAPPELSLKLLEALHERWVMLLEGLDEAAWHRGYRHPELGRVVTLNEGVLHYAWHGRHHVAHITTLRDRSGW
jgi:hypothetical protein